MRANASKSGALSAAAAAALIRGSGIVSILFLVACADVPTGLEDRADYDPANDPAEPTQFVDRDALQPVARAYDDDTALPRHNGEPASLKGVRPVSNPGA
jgi:hypothetical protein